MFSVEQIIAHGVGDYLLQSDQMAVRKTQSHRWAAFHAFVYTVPFLVLTLSPIALLIIGVTHFFIDRYKLAQYATWIKTFIDALVLSPTNIRGYFSDMDSAGFPKGVPDFMRVWIIIIVDNLIHVSINASAIYYFG